MKVIEKSKVKRMNGDEGSLTREIAILKHLCEFKHVRILRNLRSIFAHDMLVGEHRRAHRSLRGRGRDLYVQNVIGHA